MSTSPAKPVAVFGFLLGVWFLVYWVYDARPPAGISFDGPPGLSSEIRDGAEPAVQVESVEPLPPAPPLPAGPGGPSPSRTEAGPSGVTRVVPPQFRSYTVQSGDRSFDAISRRLFGTPRHADAISRSNPYVTPDKLIPGRTKLRIPLDPSNVQGRVVTVPVQPPAGTGAAAPRLAPPRPPAPPESATAGRPSAGTPASGAPGPAAEEHVVQPGETLSAVAKLTLGKASAWRRLYEANRDRIDNPDRLKPGTRLRIPPAE